MPANLNALIRYKTINNCLYGGRRRWSIRELIDACSEALSEYRGRYTTISERTVRDDIRVMRSEILGFNAPIAQKGGLYFYSDPAYSILSINLTDMALMDRICNLLYTLRSDIRHPELEMILKQLCRITGREYKERMGEFARDRTILYKAQRIGGAGFPGEPGHGADYIIIPQMSSNREFPGKRATGPGVSWRDIMVVIYGSLSA